MRTKSQSDWYLYKQYLHKRHKNSIKMTFNSKRNKQKIQTIERRKVSFLKEYVPNTNLHESVLNKIMTTHE